MHRNPLASEPHLLHSHTIQLSTLTFPVSNIHQISLFLHLSHLNTSSLCDQPFPIFLPLTYNSHHILSSPPSAIHTHTFAPAYIHPSLCTCLHTPLPYLCVILGLHGTFDPQQLLHGVLVAMGHLKVRPAYPKFLSQPRVAHLAAESVDLPRPVNFSEFPLHVSKAKAHLP